MHLVSIVGCGYTGLRLARRWLARGATVRGFATREASLAEIAASGASAVALNLDDGLGPADPRDDFTGHLVYYAVPPAPTGSADPRLERFLAGLDGAPARFVYLSTTGVYGDRAGGPVDEDTPPAPATPRAQRRLAAETSLRDWAARRGVSWCILRVPGIYGPGRLPLARLREHEPAIAPAEATPSNRIQVEDLVSACVAAGESPRADRRVFNVTDGSDDSLTAYLQRVARIAGLPEPPLISRREAERSLSASSWSFLAESRRVSNRRVREELGLALEFADLDAGIRASLDSSL
jgi:nucleoside-diphosphate-sugar epimerase